MKKESNFPSSTMWHWRGQSPFAHTVTVGDQVFISGQQSLDEHGSVVGSGDIAAQTRRVFENMKSSLEALGMNLSDLVRLNTYYVFDGDDAEATAYWEEMTRVRLEYFPNPGPAATAVRAKGMPYQGQLIQIEGVALKGESRRVRERIMPKESWDWSIAVPLSQGWKIGDRIFVGGQISADKTGASVHVGDLDAQTHNIFGYMKQILNDAGASFEDMVRLKICFKYDSRDPETGEAFVDRIMEISKEYIAGPPPVVTAFAVDLLYPGLDLELDAMAIVDSNTTTLSHTGVHGSYQPSEFSDGICAGNEIYVAGQVALEADNSIIAPGDFEGQAREVFDRLTTVLTGFDATLNDVVKLNLFLVTDADTEAMFNRVCEIWAELCPDGHPAVTPVRVHELARPGLLIQADCIAIR